MTIKTTDRRKPGDFFKPRAFHRRKACSCVAEAAEHEKPRITPTLAPFSVFGLRAFRAAEGPKRARTWDGSHNAATGAMP